jgi:cyclopropane fatty-acyl-phospholipid synthase-like methyltransferase
MQFFQGQTWFRRLFFNYWYYRKPPWDTGISPPELMEHIQNYPAGRALDLGCGTGTNVITLARHGWKVTGVDFAGHAIALARKKVKRAGVNADLYVEDVTQLHQISGTFDLILDMGCFHTLSGENVQKYIQNLQKLLAPQGTYLMYGFFKNQDEAGPGISKADLEALTRQFELVKRQDGTERGRRPSAWFTFRQAA